MSQLLTMLGLFQDRRSPSLIGDLVTGRAGIVPRACLGLALAAVLLALTMFVFGLIESTGRYVRDEHIAMGLCVAGAGWCVSMIAVWGTYRRWQRVIKTAFAILGLWVVAIPLCMIIDSTINRAEFFIAGVLLLALAISILLVITATYRSRGGKALRAVDGTVQVHCAECGYSLIGLDTCRCPECGWSFTLDELVDAQDYTALRDVRMAARKGRRIDRDLTSRPPGPEPASVADPCR